MALAFVCRYLITLCSSCPVPDTLALLLSISRLPHASNGQRAQLSIILLSANPTLSGHMATALHNVSAATESNIWQAASLDRLPSLVSPRPDVQPRSGARKSALYLFLACQYSFLTDRYAFTRGGAGSSPRLRVVPRACVWSQRLIFPSNVNVVSLHSACSP